MTCPLVLERFRRDLKLAGFSNSLDIPSLEEDEVVVSSNTSLELDGKVVIEELALKASKHDLSSLVNVISKMSPIAIGDGRIAIVHDNVFSILVQMTTEIVARVRINSETGTVETGALWYEEYLPSDTLMYSVIAIGKPKKNINGISAAEDIVRELEGFNNKFVQIGGNETVGKGFVKLRVMQNEDT